MTAGLLESGKVGAAHVCILDVDLSDHLVDQVGYRLSLFHLRSQLIEVVERHEQHFLRVCAREELILEAHGHQVEELCGKMMTLIGATARPTQLSRATSRRTSELGASGGDPPCPYSIRSTS